MAKHGTVLFVTGSLILIAIYVLFVYDVARRGLDAFPFAYIVTVATFLLVFFLAVLWAICDYIDEEGMRYGWKYKRIRRNS